MKLHLANLTIASGLAFAVIWIVCSGLVVAFPNAADVAFRGMMHAGPGMPRMEVSMSGFWIGLVGWAVSAAATGGVLAAIYNALGGKNSAS